MTGSPTRRSSSVLGALAVLVVSLTAGAASSGAHPCCGGSSQWLHQHRLQYKTILNTIDTSRLRDAASEARQAWRDRTILGLKLVTTHENARIHGRDGNYGNVPWVGLAETCFHCGHRDFFLNKYYNQTDSEWKGTSCQEMGHIIGLDHKPGDCMGKGYFSDYSNHVGSTSVDHIRTYYRNPPDGSATHIQLGTSSDKESDAWDLLSG